MAVGHPVDVASGAFFDTLVDIAFPGVVPLALERMYNTDFLRGEAGPLTPAAQDAPALPFGPGWRAGWQSELRRTLDGFKYVRNDGMVYSFVERRDVPFEQSGRILSPADGLELRRIDGERVRIIGFGQDRLPHSLVFQRGSRGSTYYLVAIERTAVARLEFVYDPAGRVTSIVQRREQRELVIQYDAWGRVVRVDVRFPDRSTRLAAGYVYDRAGRLAEVHDIEGLAESYEYDDQGRMVRETKRGGSTYTVRYRKDGRCFYVSGTDRYQERTLHFDLARRATTVYDTRGARTVYEYNPSGQVVQQISPLGSSTRFEFDEFGRPAAQTSGCGIMIRTEYDEFGHVAVRHYPGGRSETYTYDAEHRLVAIVDSTGVRVSLGYDGDHNVTEVDVEGSKPWRYEHNAYAERTAIEDPMGSRRTLAYDACGNLAFTTNWAGYTWQYQYNAMGQRIAVIDPLGGTTRTEYDASGRPTRHIGADGRTWESHFNPHENTVRKIAPDGSVTHLQLNACGQVTEIRRPTGHRIQVFWGREPGELLGIRNSRGEDYTVRYDLDGRIVERQTFDGRRILVEWKAELLKAVIDGKGQRTEYEYDVAGRVVKRTCPDGDTVYAYTPRGELAQIEGPDSTIELTYDHRGQCIAEDQDGMTLVREFDELGRPIRLDAAGDETLYGWSLDHHLMALTRGALQVTFQRDAFGSELSRTLPGAGVFAQTYDVVGRVIAQVFTPNQRSTQAGVITRNYAYDARGLVSAIDDSLRGPTSFLHDANGSLLAALRQSGNSDFYEVDGEGNRWYQAHGSRAPELLAALRNGVTLPYAAAHAGAALATTTYDENGRLARVEAIGRTLEYEYDANGCVISKTETDANGARTLRLVWNAREQLVQATQHDGRTWHYRYDGCGRRIEKRTPEGQIWRYLWNCGQLVQVLRDGQVVERYAYDPDGGAPVLRDDGEVHYVLPDHVSSSSEAVNAKGELEWAAGKGTWGEGFRAGPGAAPFYGQIYDEETGLHYNVFRYYDPDVGRFISPDPIDLAGGWNTYAAIRSPIDEYDPFGLAGGGPSERYPGPYYEHGEPGSGKYRNDAPQGEGLNANRSRTDQSYLFRTDDQVGQKKGGSRAGLGDNGTLTATRVSGAGEHEMVFFNGGWHPGGSPHNPELGIGNSHWWHSEMWAFTHLISAAQNKSLGGKGDITIRISREPCGGGSSGCSSVVGSLAQRLANASGRKVKLIHPPDEKKPHTFSPDEKCPS